MEHMTIMQHCLQSIGLFFLGSFGMTTFGLFMPWFMSSVAENDRKADEMRRLSVDTYLQLASGEANQLSSLQSPATCTTLAETAIKVQSKELPAPTNSDDELVIWLERWNNNLVVCGTTGMVTAVLIFLVMLTMCH